jgi:hypothetical protein
LTSGGKLQVVALVAGGDEPRETHIAVLLVLMSTVDTGDVTGRKNKNGILFVLYQGKYKSRGKSTR